MEETKEMIPSTLDRDLFVEDETRCCLCGTDLKFSHKIDFLTLRIQEDAHCPSCRIQMKSREHTLQ